MTRAEPEHERSSAVAGGALLWIKDVASRHPIMAYVLLTMGWSWSIWSSLFSLVGRGGLLQDPPSLAYATAFAGAAGPSVSGLLLTRLIYGSAGVRALRARLRPGQLGRWWLALLIIPGATALTPLLRAIGGHAQDGQAMLRLLVPGIGLGLAAGLMEEFGWRGFLLPHLLKRHAPLVASLLIGLIWGGFWHGYADYFGVAGDGLDYWLLLALLGPGLLTAWSLVLTCVYERTQGSLLVAILMHASISSSALILGQRYATRAEELAWTTASVAMALLVASAFWLMVHRRAERSTTDTRPRA